MFLDMFMKPFEWKNVYIQRSSGLEYLVSLFLRHMLPNFKADSVETVFFDHRLNRLFYYYRIYSQGFSGLGDTTFITQALEDMPGIWIFSKSRGFNLEFDVLLFYVQGDAFNSSSPFIYMEFLQRFVVILQEQGFRNPAISLPKLKRIGTETFPKPLARAYSTWKALTEKYSGTKIIISGDSSGATTALSLLLLISQEVETVSPVGTITGNSQKPDAALLISPITKFVALKGNLEAGASSGSYDFLTTDLVKSWGEKYLQSTTIDSDDIFLRYLGSPGLCKERDIWKSAFPKYGMILSFGSEEVLAPEIRSFISNLEGLGKLKIDEHKSFTHNWPITSYFTEKSVDDREEALNLFASMISRMLLWDSNSYFQPGAKEPAPIFRVDDKFT